MPFQITKHFFNPDPTGIEPQNGGGWVRLVASSQGFFSARPKQEQTCGVGTVGSQDSRWQPAPFAGCRSERFQPLPVCRAGRSDLLVSGLAQRVVPTPVVEVLKHERVSKLGVADQTGTYPRRQQVAHRREQRQLFVLAAMPA